MRILSLLIFCLSALFLSPFSTAHAQTVTPNFEYEVKKVSYGNLVANLYLPKTSKKVPVVIAVGGSEGGMMAGDGYGQLLAPHGIAVLGLAYFKEKGLPATLDQIPLEYFFSAIEYLQTETALDARKLGIVGSSRGAELALLLASMEPRIHSVVATTPSKVAWLGRTIAKSAWSYRGQEIPALSLELDEKAPLVSRFEAALKNPEKVKPALFAVEKINGPVLLISAEKDEIWPSTMMARDIVAQLQAKGFAFAVKHDSYPTGHGFNQEAVPRIKQSIIDHFTSTLAGS